MWSVDGSTWDIPCTVERTAEMTESEISGMLLNKVYFSDVIGTFMKYSIKIEVPFGYEEQYSSLYEILTAPVDGHEFVLPYAGGNISVTGRVNSIKDVYMRMPNGSLHWRGIAFDVIANHPTKAMTLEGVLTRGATPLPDESDVEIGATYNYSANGWEKIDSAEDNYY